MIAVNDCVTFSAFASLVVVPIRIARSARGLKIGALTLRIKKVKKYKTIIKKKERTHNKIMFLVKTKSNTFEVLISQALIDSHVTHIRLSK